MKNAHQQTRMRYNIVRSPHRLHIGLDLEINEHKLPFQGNGRVEFQDVTRTKLVT